MEHMHLNNSGELCDGGVRFAVYVTLSCIVCIVGIVGNFALLVTLLRAKRSSMNCLLVTLTLLDIVFLTSNLAIIFLYDMEYLQNLVQGAHLASIVTSWILLYIVRWSQLAGIWITVQIALERWLAISRPIKGRLRMRQTKTLSAAIILLSILYELPDFLCLLPSCERTSEYNESNESNESNASQYLSCSLKPSAWATFEYELYFVGISYAVMSFAVPLISMTIFSFMTFRTIRTVRHGSASLRKSTYTPRSNNRYTVMFVLMSIIFLVVEMPAVLCRAILGLQLMDIAHCTATNLYTAGAVCAMLYAALNFVLYSVCSKALRQLCRTSYCSCLQVFSFTSQITISSE